MEYEPQMLTPSEITKTHAAPKPPILAIMCMAIALFTAYQTSYNASASLSSGIVFGYSNPYFLSNLAQAYVLPLAVLLMTVGIAVYKKNLSVLCGVGCVLYLSVPLALVISRIIALAEGADAQQALGLIVDLLSFLPLILVIVGCFLNKVKVGRVLRIIGGILLILLLLVSAIIAASGGVSEFFDELTSYAPDTEKLFTAFRSITYSFNHTFWFDYALWMYLAWMLFGSKPKQA